MKFEELAGRVMMWGGKKPENKQKIKALLGQYRKEHGEVAMNEAAKLIGLGKCYRPVPIAFREERDRNEMRPEDIEPDWKKKCLSCGGLPTLPLTGLCGPCTFGEADTAGGNW
jgi:hypothetical protein